MRGRGTAAKARQKRLAPFSFYPQFRFLSRSPTRNISPMRSSDPSVRRPDGWARRRRRRCRMHERNVDGGVPAGDQWGVGVERDCCVASRPRACEMVEHAHCTPGEPTTARRRPTRAISRVEPGTRVFRGVRVCDHALPTGQASHQLSSAQLSWRSCQEGRNEPGHLPTWVGRFLCSKSDRHLR